MLNKSLGIVSPPHFAYDFSRNYTLLANEILLPDCFCFLRYCVLELFVSQVVKS